MTAEEKILRALRAGGTLRVSFVRGSGTNVAAVLRDASGGELGRYPRPFLARLVTSGRLRVRTEPGRLREWTLGNDLRAVEKGRLG